MARLVYSSVVRPAIIFSVSVWYTPQGIETTRKTIDRKLETLQNKSLQTVLRTYRAINTHILKKKVIILLILIVLTAQIANATKRVLTGTVTQTIKKAYTTIHNYQPQTVNRRSETQLN